MHGHHTSETKHRIAALWMALIIETVVLIAMNGYSMYESRRNNELLRSKVDALAEFSAKQGEKVDRMTTALELYVEHKLAVDAGAEIEPDSKLGKAQALLDKIRLADVEEGDNAETQE